MNSTVLTSLCLIPLIACGGCDSGGHGHDHGPDGSHPAEPVEAGGTEDGAGGDDHEHTEEPLGTVTIGALAVELAQGHGAIAPGAESHLVVKLPYNDRGATTVRAWIGGEDRTFSLVGRGEYAEAHDDYDVHASAPDPLAADALWWIEIEKPDGTRLLGSATPIR